jgi:hypothetical protein
LRWSPQNFFSCCMTSLLIRQNRMATTMPWKGKLGPFGHAQCVGFKNPPNFINYLLNLSILIHLSILLPWKAQKILIRSVLKVRLGLTA